MTCYTIYDSPLDHPGLFVVRAFDVGQGDAVPRPECTTHATLEAARDAVPPGLECFPRAPADEPQVVETWL